MTKKTEAVTDGLDLFELFQDKSNKESEENGKWVELGGGTAFKIRAFHAKRVVEYREELQKPFLQLQRAGIEIPDDKAQEIGRKIIAGALIADWKGVKNKAKDLVPYSEEEALLILEGLPKLAGWIMGYALEAQNYADSVTEEGVGNS